MNRRFQVKLEAILKGVFKKSDSFYRRKYTESGIHLKDFLSPDSFDLIPPTTLKELATTPFKERCSKEGPGLNKLIYSKEAKRYFIVHRTLDEIKNEHLFIDGTRPLVIIQDVYEAIETCLFFYEHGILPLIGEILNPAVVYATASQYNIDSVVADIESFKNFYKDLSKLDLAIKSITIIDSKAFDRYDFQGIKMNYILSLPETGPIAYACPYLKNKHFVFHPYDDIFIEDGKKTTITSVRLEACPLIRYQANISIKLFESKCTCDKVSLKLN
ncbi:MAG: hypothetical protein A2776_01215 [Candidatus Levybacteria bacterium RIFCSPHIGHO2_01_FULL_40_10]|nr:MAG: hypothetical protein A2776_01215 [Candidatus Levybacteria bacterium RIFCSPHIGHO2_01_FULL_40_10]